MRYPSTETLLSHKFNSPDLLCYLFSRCLVPARNAHVPGCVAAQFFKKSGSSRVSNPLEFKKPRSRNFSYAYCSQSMAKYSSSLFSTASGLISGGTLGSFVGSRRGEKERVGKETKREGRTRDLLRLDRRPERCINNFQNLFYRRFHIYGVNIRGTNGACGPVLVSFFKETAPL